MDRSVKLTSAVEYCRSPAGSIQTNRRLLRAKLLHELTAIRLNGELCMNAAFISGMFSSIFPRLCFGTSETTLRFC
jgi:hypothetical protein